MSDKHCTCPALSHAPVCQEDFYADEAIINPLPFYGRLRSLGPVVFMAEHRNFAVTSHDAVKQVLRNHAVFSSAHGVAGDDFGCDFIRTSTLVSDPPLHTEFRRIVSAPLLPGALEDVRPTIRAAAVRLVDGLLTRPSLDAMRDIAHHLPETVVTDLVGLPPDGRENMLHWAAAAFDLLGMQNTRGQRAVETIKELRVWMETRAQTAHLKPGSWTRRIMQMAEEGRIEDWKAHGLLSDYISPSLDTTISATGQLLYQLGRNPDQWRLLEGNPSLIPNAVNEAVRLSGAVRCMTRTALTDSEVCGVPIPKGARVMVLFACANRDPARFSDPDRFDVTRAGLGHVGFGHGIHMCVGMHLAALEMRELLQALLDRVERIEVDEPIIALNNTIYKFDSMPIRLHPRKTQLEVASPNQPVAGQVWHDMTILAACPSAENIVEIDLAMANGQPLPAFHPGGHVDVKIAEGVVRQYSLAGWTGEPVFRLGILKQPEGRGGSVALHKAAVAGAVVQVGTPRNAFNLLDQPAPSILFAGGIGITPMLSMAETLARRGGMFRLHYSVRSRSDAGFLARLERAEWRDNVLTYFSKGGQRLNPDAVMAQLPPDAHIYVCGPAPYMSAVIEAARRHGVPDERIHFEYFAADVSKTGKAFTVKLAKTGGEVEIGAEETILEALESKGLVLEKSCLSGVCGSCTTRVLDGVPDHRDLVLTDAEKAGNRVMTICCSRALSPALTLDL